MRTRLRTLTEAECYARCYGGLRTEAVAVVRVEPRRPRFEPWVSGEELRLQFERLLDAREPELLEDEAA